jgi:hypothetical protein
MQKRIQLGDIGVDVIRKDIKNVHLSVFFMTYDEMYEHLARQIASWKDDIEASKRRA